MSDQGNETMSLGIIEMQFSRSIRSSFDRN